MPKEIENGIKKYIEKFVERYCKKARMYDATIIEKLDTDTIELLKLHISNFVYHYHKQLDDIINLIRVYKGFKKVYGQILNE